MTKAALECRKELQESGMGQMSEGSFDHAISFLHPEDIQAHRRWVREHLSPSERDRLSQVLARRQG